MSSCPASSNEGSTRPIICSGPIPHVLPFFQSKNTLETPNPYSDSQLPWTDSRLSTPGICSGVLSYPALLAALNGSKSMGAPWLVRSDLPGSGGAPTHVLLVLSSLTLYRLCREVRRKRATEFEDFIDSDKKILVIPQMAVWPRWSLCKSAVPSTSTKGPNSCRTNR